MSTVLSHILRYVIEKVKKVIKSTKTKNKLSDDDLKS